MCVCVYVCACVCVCDTLKNHIYIIYINELNRITRVG